MDWNGIDSLILVFQQKKSELRILIFAINDKKSGFIFGIHVYYTLYNLMHGELQSVKYCTGQIFLFGGLIVVHLWVNVFHLTRLNLSQIHRMGFVQLPL